VKIIISFLVRDTALDVNEIKSYKILIRALNTEFYRNVLNTFRNDGWIDT